MKNALFSTFRLTFYGRWSADPHYANPTKIKPVFFCARRQPPEAESPISVEDGCSEGSEVDWSWLEEVECLRAAEPLATGGERDGEQGGDASSPTDESAERRRACDRRETAATRSAAMSVTATAKSLAVGGSRWPSPGGALLFDCQNNNNNNVGRRSGGQHRRHRNVNNNNDDDDDEDDEAARCNATNEAVDRENRYGATTTTTTTTIPVAGSIAAAANSWMRASMRRLRHLRLPEGTQRGAGEPANRRAASVSAPNSLPDIALIAPEILAAQTNGGTSGTLRPSSAPARNAATAAAVAGVATPRRTGRQFAGGGRSRGARNREAASSRQGSLGSTTTTSDITASGNTTCSSGASTSPASSTATTPQRTTSRRSVHDFVVEKMISVGMWV